MDGQLLESLSRITAEERQALETPRVNKALYTSRQGFTVDSRKLLEQGRLITLRPHTRFVEFPRHSHNYVEIMYVCSGQVTHIINGTDRVELHRGELLFLGCNSSHQILRASQGDVAVNFIVLPQFFDTAYDMIDRDNLLSRFLAESLRGARGTVGYLHFRVADVLPVQNLVENLIISIADPFPNRRHINKVTMGLLFLQLLNHTERIQFRQGPESAGGLVIAVMREIEENYRTASLSALAKDWNRPVALLSKRIRQEAGRTFQELLQEKRFAKAAEMLQTTDLTVNEIAAYVGYENTSYFHRRFRQAYQMSPACYRREACGK